MRDAPVFAGGGPVGSELAGPGEAYGRAGGGTGRSLPGTPGPTLSAPVELAEPGVERLARHAEALGRPALVAGRLPQRLLDPLSARFSSLFRDPLRQGRSAGAPWPE